MEAAKKISKIYEYGSSTCTGVERELVSFEEAGDAMIRVEDGENRMVARLPHKGEVFSFSATNGQNLRAQVIDIANEPSVLDGRKGDSYGVAYFVRVLL